MSVPDFFLFPFSSYWTCLVAARCLRGQGLGSRADIKGRQRSVTVNAAGV